MSFSLVRANEVEEIDVEAFDLVILAITGESRAWMIADKFRGSEAKIWALARKNENLTSVKLMEEIAARIPNADVVLAQSFTSSLVAFLGSLSGRVRIFMDVSCMTRSDMAVAFDEIFSLDRTKISEVQLSIGYVISKFVPPEAFGGYNEDIRPLSSRFAGWPDNPYASTSIVLGLGYESAKAEGANEFFDAQETWVFFPESPIEEFDHHVSNNNKQIIERAGRESKLVCYAVDHPAETLFRLGSIVQDLSSRSNPLILPFGPKIFAAISLLVAVLNPCLGIWHATGDTDLPSTDHEGSEYLVALEVALVRGSSGLSET